MCNYISYATTRYCSEPKPRGLLEEGGISDKDKCQEFQVDALQGRAADGVEEGTLEHPPFGRSLCLIVSTSTPQRKSERVVMRETTPDTLSRRALALEKVISLSHTWLRTCLPRLQRRPGGPRFSSAERMHRPGTSPQPWVPKVHGSEACPLFRHPERAEPQLVLAPLEGDRGKGRKGVRKNGGAGPGLRGKPVPCSHPFSYSATLQRSGLRNNFERSVGLRVKAPPPQTFSFSFRQSMVDLKSGAVLAFQVTPAFPHGQHRRGYLVSPVGCAMLWELQVFPGEEPQAVSLLEKQPEVLGDAAYDAEGNFRVAERMRMVLVTGHNRRGEGEVEDAAI